MKLGYAIAINRLFKLESSEKVLLATNSFGLLRLMLAISVLFQHSLVLTGFDQFSYFGFFGEVDFGSTGVWGFFAVSGFLLAGSAQRLGNREFFIHRLLRLLPGLWFALIISAFAIVPLASFLSKTRSEFSLFTGNDSSLSYVLLNLGLVVFQDSIGNVFGNNPFPLAVNGSLWTLAPEFICYIGLLSLAMITKRRASPQKASLLTVVIVASVAWWLTGNSVNPILTTIVQPALGLGIAFATGSFFAFIIKEHPYRPRPLITLPFLAFWLFLGLSGPIAIVCLALIVVSLGLSLTNASTSNIGRTTDISYGIYLFHFPAIQAIIFCTAINWTPTTALTLLPAMALFAAAPLAWVSWKFIEKPSISFARTFARR
jgi:peptidoglycan/LPS O-acetylase OafA/YrhL